MASESKSLVPANYLLRPGYIFVATRPTAISVVLGSSVAVSIYDKRRMVGGMNHFRVPQVHNRDHATASYGDAATLTLIRMMITDGSKTKHLEAHIFGGAYNREVCARDVGRENVMVARRVLTKQQIRIISEDVGGQKGRKVVFHTHTNETAVLKVDKLRKSDWHPYENGR
jgi:chemotaxis protein CheD